MAIPLLLPELRELLEAQDQRTLREFCGSSHPATVAELLEALAPEEVWRVLAALEPAQRALIFGHFSEGMQTALAGLLRRGELAELVTHMSHDERVDLFHRLPEARRENLLPALAQAEREDIRRLSSYPEGSAGAVMTSDYAVLVPELTAAQAIEKLRREAPDKETIYYSYVVDEKRRLLGSISLKDLILAPPSTPVGALMERQIIYAHAVEDQEEVARKISKFDLLALPVVNEEDVLVGIVTHDDALDVVSEEATEDIQKLGGTEALGEPYLSVSLPRMIWKRAGWLTVLFFGEMLTASAMAYFEGSIARAVVLALFVPLIISSGGNSGSQASTLVIRAMALGELGLRDWWRVVRREFVTGFGLGAVLAAFGFLRILLWQGAFGIYGEHYMLVAATVGLSLLGVVLMGTLAGSTLPFALRRAGFDPASASAPFVATFVDVSGLLLYFTLASLILGGTLL